MAISVNTKYLNGFIAEEDFAAIYPEVERAHGELHTRTGKGSEWLGWLTWPSDYDKEELARIKLAAQRIRSDVQVLVVVGIGGSYLGTRAALEALLGPHYNETANGAPAIYFAGNTISPKGMQEILTMLQGKTFAINVISKSGTTTEPALAFRILKEHLEERVGKEKASEYIYVTTDAQKGTLRELSQREGYETFTIPGDIGGRYSVLTAVGLLAAEVAGLDSEKILAGAARAQSELALCTPENLCYRYAAARNILYRGGKKIELFTSYEPALTQLGEWYKQLFGESEGKDGKGIFPAAATYSSDLHSMGQLVQAGERSLFETVLWVGEPEEDIEITALLPNFDGLNFLAGKTLSQINEQAMLGTMLAHMQGGVPCLLLGVPRLDEGNFGYLIYFLEKACALSGYILGVNPFDQPGVEQYKANMFALLGKPGFEAEGERLRILLQE